MDSSSHPDGVEWLDLGPPPREQRAGPSSDRGARHRRWYVLAVAIVTAGALITAAIIHQGAARPTAGRTSPHSRPSSAQPVTGRTGSVLQPGSGDPTSPVVRELRHSILAIKDAWELFGVGSDVVVRVEFAHGRVTATPVPTAIGEGASSYLIGPDRVVVRLQDAPGGYVVRDGDPARSLDGALAAGGLAFPGPEPDEVWIQVQPGFAQNFRLVGTDGTPRSGVIRMPLDAFPQAADGAGNLVVQAVGGLYDADRHGLTRITTGALLASGPKTWLVQECDVRYRCSTIVVNRATGARRVLRIAPLNQYQPGVISPDGRYVALLSGDSTGAGTLHVLDLSTATERTVAMTLAAQTSLNRLLVWSPDSRWLFGVNAAGKMYGLDARTAHVHYLDLNLPEVSEVAIRKSSSG